MIPYSSSAGSGGIVQLTMAAPSNVNPTNFASGITLGVRTYAINAQTAVNSNPTFTNLDQTLTYLDTDTPPTTLLTLIYSDVDPKDTVLTVAMTTTSSEFQLNGDEVQPQTGQWSVGTYPLTFTVTDQCGNVGSGTLTVEITNTPPDMTAMVSSDSVKEDVAVQTHMTDLTVTDVQGYSCIYTGPHPFNVQPKTTGSTTYSLFLNGEANLNYNTQNQYTLTITCTDNLGLSSTKDIVVSIIENAPPSMNNLPSAVDVDTLATTTSTGIFPIAGVDTDSTNLFYNMTCTPVNCPFQVLSSGKIVATEDLNLHKTPAYDINVWIYDKWSLVGPETLSVTITKENVTVFEELDRSFTNDEIREVFNKAKSGKSPDINDIPEINNIPSGLIVSVPENTATSKYLINADVTDGNAADTHRFSAVFTPAEGSNYFSLYRRYKFDETMTIHEQKKDLHGDSGKVRKGKKTMCSGWTDGIVTPKVNLDYEELLAKEMTSFDVAMTADDGREQSTTKYFTIEITDVNEQQTGFSQPTYQIAGVETTTTFPDLSPTLANSVIDPDDKRDTQTLTMDCGANTGLFSMDPSTGRVTKAAEYDLDASQKTSETITCVVTATDEAGHTVTADLNIVINEENDNPPLLNKDTYTYFLPINTRAGSQFGPFSSTDIDVLPDHNDTSYTLTGGAGLFGVTDCCRIYNNVNFSTTTYNVGDSFPMTLTAKNNNGLKDTAAVNVILIDPVTTTAASAATAITTTSSPSSLAFPNFDDLGSISNFLDDPETLAWFIPMVILLAAMLTLLVYIIYRCIRSPGAFSKIGKLCNSRSMRCKWRSRSKRITKVKLPKKVKAKNIKGNKVASQSCGTKIVGEASPATVVDNLDTASTGVGYLTTDTKYTFDCCGLVTKWHTVISALGTIRFQIWRPNGANYDLVGENIFTFNTNSNPTFTNLDQTLTYLDTDTPPTTLLTLTFTDSDPQDTALTVAMTTTSTQFQIDATYQVQPQTGQWSVGTYPLTFTVTDQCGNVGSGTLTVEITNTAPDMTAMATAASVKEDVVVQTHLTDLTVTDVQGYSCTYTGSHPFNVQPKTTGSTTYSLFLNGEANLNYNTQNQYTLTITCTDNLGLSSTKDIVVSITENASPSMNNIPNAVDVDTLATTTSTEIFSIAGVDTDSTNLFYNMTCTPVNCPFQVLSSGKIVATEDLNLHKTPAYDINVWIYDKWSLVGPETLSVTLTNINDIPVISNIPTGLSLSIPENSAISTVILDTAVTDGNPGDTNTFSAVFSPAEGTNYFRIISGTGVIRPTQVIDYEELLGNGATSFNVAVTANDGREDSVTKYFTLAVTDVNEQQTGFTQDTYQISGVETTTTFPDLSPTLANSVIDPDDTRDTQTLTMDCGANTGLFSMDPSTGRVTKAAEYDLDATKQPSDTVACVVTATDEAGHTVTTNLNIIINEENDNPPELNQDVYTYFLPINTGAGSQFGPFSSTDADVLTDHTDTTYTLTGGSGLFGYTDCCSIYNNVNFSTTTYNVGDSFPMTLTALNKNGLKDTATVNVILTDPVTTTTVTAATTTTTVASAATLAFPSFGGSGSISSFLDDPENLGWFIPTMILLAAMLALLGYMIYRCIRNPGTFAKLANICKGRTLNCKWPQRSKMATKTKPPKRIGAKNTKGNKGNKVRQLDKNDQNYEWNIWSHSDFGNKA
ncbi:uncharacterized protein LOC132558167 [Ylistrum balloti]|uniref:uncharacterized protein LOC132558167 n=1 Tax=Ylistrum balloti TaxID=509963 RepID=UPI002905B03C|nr:uncharacterized protein LOC132558167 [Ylistrum balloti]